jgi:hypothetical protein
MEIKNLEVGKYYGCLLTKRHVLVIETKDTEDKVMKAGVMGIANMKDDGEMQIGYNTINIYDGQLIELDNQPEFKNK